MESNGSIILNDLPIVYNPFFPDFFQKKVPKESLATCTNCAMVCSDTKKDTTKLAMRPFRKDIKCCTYFPSLPSYLVGGALIHASSEGIKRLEDTIAKKVGVTPFGLNAPNVYNVLYKNQSEGFGNSESLRCPYYVKESGNCSIWKFREAVCSTYFCKHVSGSSGNQFWMDVKKYLHHVEQSLVLHFAEEAKFDYFLKVAREFKSPPVQLTAEDLDGLPPRDYEKLWGKWAGREAEFYKWTYQKVTEISKSDFIKITGIKQKVLLNNLETQRRVMLDIPEHIKVHKDWLPHEHELSKMIRFKSIDIQFELPSKVLNAFDGEKTWEEVVKHLDVNEGIELEESLILSLFHHGILEKQE